MTRWKAKAVMLGVILTSNCVWCRRHRRHALDCRYNATPGQGACSLDHNLCRRPFIGTSRLPLLCANML